MSLSKYFNYWLIFICFIFVCIYIILKEPTLKNFQEKYAYFWGINVKHNIICMFKLNTTGDIINIKNFFCNIKNKIFY